jgi:hypothetical protein
MCATILDLFDPPCSTVMLHTILYTHSCAERFRTSSAVQKPRGSRNLGVVFSVNTRRPTASRPLLALMSSDPDGSSLTGFRGTGSLTIAAMYLDAAIKREHTAYFGQPPTFENGGREKVLDKNARDKGIRVQYERRPVDGEANEVMLHNLIKKHKDADIGMSNLGAEVGGTSQKSQPRLDCDQNELFFKQILLLEGNPDKSCHLPVMCHPTRGPS